ncbi:MAG: putative metal-binding motif-containing protein [Natrialbaceae archaeon]|nr:putative metal-binding motif-containing protein [Natrialbaceae archaeon]
MDLSFDHANSNTSIRENVGPSIPADYNDHIGGLELQGLYSGQSVDMEFESQTYSGTHPATLAVYQQNGSSWEQIPHLSDWTPGSTVVNLSATLPKNGIYEALATSEVANVTVVNDTVAVGDEEPLTVEARYIDGTVLHVSTNSTLFSADPSIASIDGTAVTGESPGTTTITAYYTDPHSLDEWNGTGQVEVIEGPDPVPESYYGTLDINGTDAPAGTTVTARIDGTVVGSLTTNTMGQYGGAGPFQEKLSVAGSASDVGESIEFHVDPAGDLIPGFAAQNATFSPDNQTELNLTATLETPLSPTYETTIENDGGVTAVGFPAPVNATLGELFNDTAGLNAFYVHSEDGWEQVWQPSHQFEALGAFVVTTSGDGPAEINVTLPFRTDTNQTDRTLESGWSLVPAPVFTDAETAFGTPQTLLVLDEFGEPNGTLFDTVNPFESYVVGSTAWGASAPEVNPFGAYFVYAESSTTISQSAESFPHRQALDIQLGIREDDGLDADGDGFSILAGDCDDSDSTIYPGAPELADGLDNDCDGQIE